MKSRGKRVAIVSGTIFLLVVSFTAFHLSAHLRFWWQFESLGPNDQGYPEFRHRRTGILMVRVPGGRFVMGLADSEEEAAIRSLVGQRRLPRGLGMLPKGILQVERPAHEVELSPFLISKFEVTQAEWAGAMPSSPSVFSGDDLPVHNVSWDDGHEFCAATGLRFPTEAQWEYACRAGTTGPYGGTGRLADMGWSFVLSTVGAPYSSSASLVPTGSSQVARRPRGPTRAPQPVGQKRANAFGLHDMHGNVAEWCEDTYDSDFYSQPAASAKDPVCRSGRAFRVRRGGGWGLHPLACRSASRGGLPPGDRSAYVGLRVAYYPVP